MTTTVMPVHPSMSRRSCTASWRKSRTYRSAIPALKRARTPCCSQRMVEAESVVLVFAAGAPALVAVAAAVEEEEEEEEEEAAVSNRPPAPTSSVEEDDEEPLPGCNDWMTLVGVFKNFSTSTPPPADTPAAPKAINIPKLSSVHVFSPSGFNVCMSSKHNTVAAQKMMMIARHCSQLMLLFRRQVERRAAKTIRAFMMAVKM